MRPAPAIAHSSDTFERHSSTKVARAIPAVERSTIARIASTQAAPDIIRRNIHVLEPHEFDVPARGQRHELAVKIGHKALQSLWEVISRKWQLVPGSGNDDKVCERQYPLKVLPDI